MNASDDWQLHILGAFRLQHGDRQIRIVRRKVACLLAYLIPHPDKRTRQDLATLFWGDFPDTDALRSLRTALSVLRSTVDGEIVIADGESARFNPTFQLWVDALEFQSYAVHFLAEDPFDLSTSFIDLYQGDLLRDFYDDWITPERDRLRSLYLDVLLHVAQQMRSRSEYERAIGFARRVLAIEPANERAHQHIMFCYIAMGDRSAALKQYEICRQGLEDDLGVEPMPETTALYHWIRGRPGHEPAREALITNLPIPLTTFVGREPQMAEIRRRLTQTRLLTLTGPGGSGKTRLAIQVATDLVDAYKDGVWFIDLAPLHDPAQVGAAVARTLRVEGPGSSPITDALVAFLRNRRTLLVLDNCEHLVDACAQIAQDILSAAPQVTILATSRESLAVQGEVMYQVPALLTPSVAAIRSSLAALAGFEASRLFIERATAAYPEISLSDRDSPAIIAVCRQLEGMPLAIELAAARANMLSVGQIADLLRERFALLASSGRVLPLRQTSLRAAIDWSYDLLPGDEQALLCRLSVFAGSFSLAGASAVHSESQDASILDQLSRLVDKSLVVIVQSGQERRYRLLDTIRLYAWDKLAEAGEKDAAMSRCVSLLCGLTERSYDADLKGDGQVRVQDINLEFDNLRAAVAWCGEARDWQQGLRLVAPLFFIAQADLHEVGRWLNTMLAMSEDAPPLLRGRALASASSLAAIDGDYERSFVLAQESLALCQPTGDKAAIAFALCRLGRTAGYLNKLDMAEPLLVQSLALSREIGYDGISVKALDGLARLRLELGDDARAAELAQELLTLSREINDGWGTSMALNTLGQVALRAHNDKQTTAFFQQSLAACLESGWIREMTWGFVMLADIAAGQGQSERSAILWGAANAISDLTGRPLSFSGSDGVTRIAEVRAQLGETAFDVLVAKGRAMTPEQAVAYALRL